MIRELVDEAVAAGARRWRACEVLGLTTVLELVHRPLPEATYPLLKTSAASGEAPIRT
jgi:hypothetical protein